MSEIPRVLAVVPARAASKGLARKNLREIGGRSLVAWAVEAARDARLVDRVVGSTDSEEIAEALEKAGADVPVLRPAALAGDDAPDPPVFLHVLDVLAGLGYEPDVVVNVRPTAPLRTGADIDAAVQLLLSCPAARSVKSVSAVTEHPYKMWAVAADGFLEPILPAWHQRFGGDPDIARQRLPVVYRSDGGVDAVWVSVLRETGAFHPGPVAAYVMDPARALDIDDEEDVLVAAHRLGEDRR